MSNLEDGAVSELQRATESSAGALLKAARERSGLHIAALAVMLKVPVKKLEWLEASRFDLLPDMVFVRALASSVCRTLKVDAAPILELLPQTGPTQLVFRTSAVNAPFRSSNDGPGASRWSSLPKSAVVAVALLLLASLAVAYLPALSAQFTQFKALVETKMTKEGSSPAKGSNAEAVDLKREKVMAGSPVATVAPSTGADATAGTQSNAAVASSPSAAFQDPVPIQSAASTTSGLVVFRAVGESWVEVLDAKRQIVLRRTLATGESIGVSGTLPLSATVGRANMTQVEVRGQAFDLAPWSKDNVARFEVK